MKKSLYLIISLLGVAFTLKAAGFELTPDRKLQYAEGIISTYYVDDVNRDTIVDEAIKAMLKTLDPHSLYTSPEETREFTEPLTGNFSGIGIQFNIATTDTLYVIQTIAGGPSEKVGILPGDRIIEVNDTLIAGVKMKNSEVMKRLRGPKGTTVNVKVLRHGVDKLIDFSITRDDIPIYSIDAAYMADPETGYIRISQFAEKTPKEFDEALDKLRKQGMKNLIIDLQDNGGGYLNAATELANFFIYNGYILFYTEALRTPSFSHKAEKDGDFTKGRVVVLVNNYSASASEILSGALQDHDRGVIVGRRTFGKGLVQRPFPFPDGSMIRLTISRYHTPSGRCIQKPYTKGDLDDYHSDMKHRFESGELMHSDSIHLPDSLKFITLKTHRPVYGGGGIMPDKFVPLDTMWYTPYYRDVLAKGIIYKWALSYMDAHRGELSATYPTEMEFAEKFDVSPEIMQQVIDRATDEGTTYDEEQYAKSSTYMKSLLKALLARDLFENGSYFRIMNELNPIYVEGLRLINQPKEYNELLNR